MLSYFPQIYPGELLYSVLARYHYHMGAPSPIHTMEALFGRRLAIAALDLPGGLDALCNRIPSGPGLNCDDVINGLTLLPYYMAFQSESVRRSVFESMKRGEVEGTQLKLGIPAFRAGRILQLRFCPICIEEMRERFGEYYWRRDQQLPGVVICPLHGVVLKQSSVRLTSYSRHAFMVANDQTCPENAYPLLLNPSSRQIAILWQIAQASASLLSEPGPARTPSEWTKFYRKALYRVGMAYSPSRMRQRELEEGMREYFGSCLRWLPGVMEDNRFSGDWLSSMVHRREKAIHPLYHLLLQGYLQTLQMRELAFGEGPWPCLNPLHRKRSVNSIQSCSQHRGHGRTVAVFACRCGYVYTRAVRDSDGILEPPHFMRYGPLLEPVLRDLVKRKFSLRRIARCVQLDPKTVVRLALELGVPLKSRMNFLKAKSSKQSVDSARRKRRQPGRKKVKLHTRRVQRPRKDWEKLDLDLCSKVKEKARAIRNRLPPVRVSTAEIERELGRRCWIGKRKTKLPHTVTIINKLQESLEAFQKRRVAWALDELLLDGGRIQAAYILRKAGLRSSQMSMVRGVMAARGYE